MSQKLSRCFHTPDTRNPCASPLSNFCRKQSCLADDYRTLIDFVWKLRPREMSPMPTFSMPRAALVLILVGVGFSALMGRVAYLQTVGREHTIRMADRQQHRTEIIQGRRGCIFDSNGLLMAGTIQQRAMFIDPKFMQDCYQSEGHTLDEMDADVEQLAKLIDMEPFELSQLIGEKYESRFVRVAENLDERTCEAITNLDIPGVGLLPMQIRTYPMGSIGSHILGGTGKDGTGLEGAEMKFEKVLAGKNGYKRTLKDSRGHSIGVAAEDYLPPEHGQHLVLTIDSNIQMIVEQELANTCNETRAQRGEAIMMDPKTGDVLALANWPTFNPENLEDSMPETRRNRCLTDPYEPGSTIKPFIVGPAIAWKQTSMSDTWPVLAKTYKSSLRSKLVADVHAYGQPLTTWDVLVKSSNIGMTMLGEKLYRNKIPVKRAFDLWHFGQQTGIELPGEDPGYVKPAKEWGTSDVVSAVQGYSVMVTPLQLARSFCAYANGGRLVQPRIIKGVLDADGDVVSQTPVKDLKMMPEAVDPVTASEIKRILCDVPVRGTATKARSKTWNIFGKTGTAHVAKNGSYNETAYTSSFISGAPAENPRIVLAFIIHEPDRNYMISKGQMYYGGSVAGPGAGKVIERTLSYMQVPASPPLPLPPPEVAKALVLYNPKVYGQMASVSE